jgi:hypothetical protein
LRSPTFPAASAGAAKRTTCQNGKFHGITASTTPNGSYRTRPTPCASSTRVSGATNRGPCSA